MEFEEEEERAAESIRKGDMRGGWCQRVEKEG
jgi:hypothetical protein